MSERADQDDVEGVVRFRRQCRRCRGRRPEPGGTVCERCRGEGEETATVLLEDVFTPDIVDFLDTWAPYHNHGILPERGGWNQQPATWTVAANRLEAIVAGHRDRRIAEAAEKYGKK